MFGQTSTAEDTDRLLDAALQQDRPSTPTLKPLEKVAAAEILNEQSLALHHGLDHHPTIQPPGWITKPSRLGKSKKSLCFDLAFDLVMILVPLPFFVLGAAVALAHGELVQPSKTDTLIQATKTVRKFSCLYHGYANAP